MALESEGPSLDRKTVESGVKAALGEALFSRAGKLKLFTMTISKGSVPSWK